MKDTAMTSENNMTDIAADAEGQHTNSPSAAFEGSTASATVAHASLVPSLDASQIPSAELSIHDQVREYYGRILSSSDDLKTNASCCTTAAPPKYVIDVMGDVADEIMERFYGCGSPIPPALEGCTVVDLGCGVGRDVYILSKLVGETGRVIGVDMTQSQLDVALKYQDEQARRFVFARSNVEFKCGYIEDLAELGIEDGTVDLVVSNCVINLTPFKEQVFSEIYRVLKPGGELYFSDVFCDRRMPPELRSDPVLVGECLGGAIYIDDFRRMMARQGWESYVYTVIDDIHVSDLALETKLGFMSFTSRTVRAIKTTGLEDQHENYGQTARYLGTIPEMPRYFDLTDEIRLIKGRKVAISSNMAEMLAQSRYGRHFDISPRGTHRGAFDARRAQDAIEARRGKIAVDLDYVSAALERVGAPAFAARVDAERVLTAPATPALETMQVNITYACNLACRHCYLECSPHNQEAMSRTVMQACLDAFSAGGFAVMDITGGSPELHPDFSWFLTEAAARAKAAGGYVIVRSNLTLLDQPEYAHFIDEYAAVGAHVTASIPYYNSETADAQRGRGVFERAMRVIRELNKRGYGIAGGRVSALAGADESASAGADGFASMGAGASAGADVQADDRASADVPADADARKEASSSAASAGSPHAIPHAPEETSAIPSAQELQLDLVYNVSGPFLPPPQDLLADLYREELARREGIQFNSLFAFNNYPLGRFAHDLLDAQMFDTYLKLLVDNFNALAVQRMMCRAQVNVDVDGRLYDCEVNHVLELPIQLPVSWGEQVSQGHAAAGGSPANDNAPATMPAVGSSPANNAEATLAPAMSGANATQQESSSPTMSSINATWRESEVPAMSDTNATQQESEASAQTAAAIKADAAPFSMCGYDGPTRDATVFDLAAGPLPERPLRTHPVCYSCAAGFGSSCGGSLVHEYSAK